jgi:MFS family permease
VQLSLVWIAWPLSLALAGPVTDLVGLRAWYVAGGLVAALAGLAALSSPTITHLEADGEAISDSRACSLV